MEFLRFLKQQSGALTTRFIVIAVVAGVANGLLISVIIAATSTKHGSSEQIRDFVLFILCFLLYVLTRKHTLDRTSRIVEGVVRRVRVKLLDKVRRTELSAFEDIGATTIQQAIAQDSQTMSDAASSVTSALSSVVLVVVSLLYIALLSTTAFLAITLLTGLMVFFYSRNYNSIRQRLVEAWEVDNHFFQAAEDELEGFKELKINQGKAEDLFENDIRAVAERSEGLKVRIAHKFNWNIVFGQSFFYALIAMVIFILPELVDTSSLPVSKIVAIILFVIGPLSEVVSAAPALARANVAAARVQSLVTRLEEVVVQEVPADGDGKQQFESLACDQLMFRYPEVSGRRPFQVGPFDLKIGRGEILFLVGGNGTGKSTLLRLLCGLQPPTEGRIYLNGQAVTRSRIADYRACFSIILQDFRLFRRLLGLERIDHARADDLLEMLQLHKITSVGVDGRITNMNLSTGQRKRLALLVAELDDRDVYIFDEWAADQDPEFRKYFYEVYLQSLRERGKTVIAATHDDHYFHVADRVLKLLDGQITDMDRAGLFRPSPGENVKEYDDGAAGPDDRGGAT